VHSPAARRLGRPFVRSTGVTCNVTPTSGANATYTVDMKAATCTPAGGALRGTRNLGGQQTVCCTKM